jgi:hypothetical protein
MGLAAGETSHLLTKTIHQIYLMKSIFIEHKYQRKVFDKLAFFNIQFTKYKI